MAFMSVLGGPVCVGSALPKVPILCPVSIVECLSGVRRRSSFRAQALCSAEAGLLTASTDP